MLLRFYVGRQLVSKLPVHEYLIHLIESFGPEQVVDLAEFLVCCRRTFVGYEPNPDIQGGFAIPAGFRSSVSRDLVDRLPCCTRRSRRALMNDYSTSADQVCF